MGASQSRRPWWRYPGSNHSPGPLSRLGHPSGGPQVSGGETVGSSVSSLQSIPDQGRDVPETRIGTLPFPSSVWTPAPVRGSRWRPCSGPGGKGWSDRGYGSWSTPDRGPTLLSRPGDRSTVGGGGRRQAPGGPAYGAVVPRPATPARRPGDDPGINDEETPESDAEEGTSGSRDLRRPVTEPGTTDPGGLSGMVTLSGSIPPDRPRP